LNYKEEPRVMYGLILNREQENGDDNNAKLKKKPVIEVWKGYAV